LIITPGEEVVWSSLSIIPAQSIAIREALKLFATAAGLCLRIPNVFPGARYSSAFGLLTLKAALNNGWHPQFELIPTST
jgi:hypothetical protein